MNTPNLYDAILLAGVIAGALTSKRGLPVELLPLGRWVAVAAVGAAAHKPVANFMLGLMKTSFAVAASWTYVILALAVIMASIGIKTAIQRSLESYKFFGKADYHLGLAAGGFKALCVAVAALAVLNVHQVSDAKLTANAKMQQESFGAISFPTLGKIQKGAVQDSLFGGLVSQSAPFLLIQQSESSERNSVIEQRKATWQEE